jgi:hypothetical protein
LWTYRIDPYKAAHKAATPRDYLRKDFILARQIERCPIKVGDQVRITTSRGKRWGVVAELLTDPATVEWKNGTQPFFISVRCPLQSIVDGTPLTYGSEIVNVPLKKIRK